MTMDDSGDWARETFAGAQLGDERRVRRLVAMAAQVARAPAGKVTQVFEASAAREGAFRWLESPAVPEGAVAEAVFKATARSCSGCSVVYVAVDGSSLTLSDRAKRRELGRVGGRFVTRGLHVMSALAVDQRGAALGLLDQQWWARSEQPKRKPGERGQKCLGKKYLDRETRYWLQSLADTQHRLETHGDGCRAWYQLDRGADCWPVFDFAIKEKLLITVRATHDRRLVSQDGRRNYLHATLKKRPVLGHYAVEMPVRPHRPARTARIALRSCRVSISARVGSNRRQTFVLNAVLAEEVGRKGRDRLQWFLLTTAPVTTFEQARAVALGYTFRWRVEEFHRTWKRGLCRVEDTQLQSRSALIKWATILAAVAARALRLAQILRTTPDIPATDEFTEYEIDAAFILAKRKRDPRQQLRFAEVVELIADLGGFAHKYSGSKPGPTVLGRGLERVKIMALGLKNMEEM